MIETNIKRTRKRSIPIQRSASQIIVLDTYGPPVSEDIGYEINDLIHIYPGSTGDVPSSVDSIIHDEPGSFRYRGDPISQILKQLDDLNTRKRDLLKDARARARSDSLRSVKLRRLVTRYRTRRTKELYFDDQGRVRYRWVSHREAYQAWYYFSVIRVEPVRYRMLKAAYTRPVNERYQTERQRLLAEVSELKQRRAAELRKELRTASACQPVGVIPVSGDLDGAQSLDFCVPPDYPTSSDPISWVPTPSLARPGNPIVSIDEGPGVSLMTAWGSWNGRNTPSDATAHGYHQCYVILPFRNSSRRSIPLTDLTVKPGTIVPEPRFASAYSVAEGRAEINRLSMAVQSGHLSESDRTFVLARSIGELKDLPATFKQGLSFLNSLGNLAKLALTSKGRAASAIVGALTSKSTLREAASWWLAWRFAIKPTIDDVQYLLDNGFQAAAEIRRTLSSLSHDLRDELVNLTTRGLITRIPRVGSVGATAGDTVLAVDAHLPVTVYGSVYSCVWGISPSSAQPSLADMDRVLQNMFQDSPANYLFYGHDANYLQGNDGNPIWTQVLSGKPFISVGSQTLSYEEFKRNGGSAGLTPVISSQLDQRLVAEMAQTLDVLHVPVVYRERVAAAVTGQFWLNDLRALLSDRGPLQMVLDRGELIFTAWELAPLSFVIDWLATTHRSILTLSDLVSKQINGLEPRDLVVSMTNLLYAHSPVLSRELTKISQATTCDYADVELLYPHMSDTCARAWAETIGNLPDRPCKSVTTDYSIRCQFSSRSGPLVKTGIRRFIRGRYTRSLLERIMDSMPRLRIRLDASKVATLLAMFGFR